MNYLCKVNSAIMGCIGGAECSKSYKKIINTISYKTNSIGKETYLRFEVYLI